MARVTDREVRLFQDAHLTKKLYFVGPDTVFSTPASSFSVEYQSFKVSDILCSEKAGGPYTLLKDGYLAVEGTSSAEVASSPSPGGPPQVDPKLDEVYWAIDVIASYIKSIL